MTACLSCDPAVKRGTLPPGMVILSRVWDEFREPNDSRDLGSDRPNRVLRRRFCTVLDLPLYELLERCDRAHRPPTSPGASRSGR